MNILEHIKAGHYPTDEKGRALVPMRTDAVATICAIDGPKRGRPIIGFSKGTHAPPDTYDWPACGKFEASVDGHLDLLPPPPRKVKVTAWAQVAPTGDIRSLMRCHDMLPCVKNGRTEQTRQDFIIQLTGEYEEPWS